MTTNKPMTELDRILLSLAQAITDVAGSKPLQLPEQKQPGSEVQALQARIEALEATQNQLAKIIEQQSAIITSMVSPPKPPAPPTEYASNVQVLPKRP